MAKFKVVCPKGHQVVRSGDVYCRECGSLLSEDPVENFDRVYVVTEPLEVVVQCSRCSTDIHVHDQFCSGCGRPVPQKGR